MKAFECVCRGNFLEDPYHAPYMKIYAENRNKAKYLYSKIHKCSYTNILVRTEKGFSQWQ